MALVSFGGRIAAPEYPTGISGTAQALVNNTIDADGEGIGMIFRAPEAGLITGFGALTGPTVTTGDANMVWQLEGVDTSTTPAKPNGSIIAAGAFANVNPVLVQTWYDAVFGTPYNATRGELMAAVIKRPAGGAFNGQFRSFGVLEGGTTSPMFPYLVVNVGAGWVAGQTSAPIFAVSYNGTYHAIRGVWPTIAQGSEVWNSSANPNVRGVRWIPRFKCRVAGVWVICNAANAYTVNFYDVDGVTVLASATGTANMRSSTTMRSAVFLPFSATVTPTVGATYWIGILPGASNFELYRHQAQNAAIMNAFSLGTDFHFDSANNPSGVASWTGTVAVRRPLIGVAIDQLDDGLGGGIISKSLIAGGA